MGRERTRALTSCPLLLRAGMLETRYVISLGIGEPAQTVRVLLDTGLPPACRHSSLSLLDDPRTASFTRASSRFSSRSSMKGCRSTTLTLLPTGASNASRSHLALDVAGSMLLAVFADPFVQNYVHEKDALSRVSAACSSSPSQASVRVPAACAASGQVETCSAVLGGAWQAPIGLQTAWHLTMMTRFDRSLVPATACRISPAGVV